MAKEVFKGELETLMECGATLVDVRESEELEEVGGLPGHTHVPLSRLGELSGCLSKEQPTIFYCRSGLRSFQAAQIAALWTSAPVYYLAGGLLAFADA